MITSVTLAVVCRYTFNDCAVIPVQVSLMYSRTIWAWHGWLAVYFGVADHACGQTGIVLGNITVTVEAGGKV